jgi:hydroxymethylglutaryl-CoA synthase
MIKTGIDSIAFHTSAYYLPLADLANARGVDPNKFIAGLGQEKMAVPPPGEDIVTLGTHAAAQALDQTDRADIGLLLFATESGIDQSKAAGIYTHRLLGLPSSCRVLELKQACYSATGGLQLATAWVAQNPHRKALVVAADSARYGFGTPGEPTQGCGAVALVISAHPRILELEPDTGVFTTDIMDFWRPNYRDEAIVDGKYSTRMYIQALIEAWTDYTRQSRRTFADHDFFCYHLPFTRMAGKAHTRLAKAVAPDVTAEQLERQLHDSLHYNRICGNSYAASLYIGLCSLLDHHPTDLGGRRIGFFSYGSGCVAECFSGIVAANYRAHLHTAAHTAWLSQRDALDVATYEKFYRAHTPTTGGTQIFTPYRTGCFRWTGVQDHQRIYEDTHADQRAG